MAERGDIVIVIDVLDPQGGNPKDRRCVIVSSAEQIAAGGPLEMVAITTTLPPDPLPFDHVPLPWHPQSQARTGLNKRNAAVCSWLMEVEESRVDRTIGRVPGKKMLEIDAILRTLRGGDKG